MRWAEKIDFPVGRGPAIFLSGGLTLTAIEAAQTRGALGVLGVVILCFGCVFSVASLTVITRTLARAAGRISNQAGVTWAVSMMLLKWPITLGGIGLGWVLMGGAWLPFFATIVLVYSSTVWNLVSPHKRENRDR